MRRKLIAPCLALLLLTSLSLCAVPREDTQLATGWQFQAGEPTNAAASNLDTSSWQSISLPHCWGWELAQQGKKYLRGAGWYRR